MKVEYVQEPQSPTNMQTPCKPPAALRVGSRDLRREPAPKQEVQTQSWVHAAVPGQCPPLETLSLFPESHTQSLERAGLRAESSPTSAHTLGLVPWAASTLKQGQLVPRSELLQQRPQHPPHFASSCFPVEQRVGQVWALPRSTCSELSVCHHGQDENTMSLN